MGRIARMKAYFFFYKNVIKRDINLCHYKLVMT